MKRNSAFLIFTAIIFFIGAAQNSFAQTKLEATVNAYIARQAKLEKASEYGDARKVLTGDLDGDGDADAVLQYTLEGFGGGNSFAQTLVVFINNKGVYKATNEVVVGGKMNTHTSTLDRIADRKIILNTEACPPDVPQGICDNPKKGIASYVLRGRRLKKG